MAVAVAAVVMLGARPGLAQCTVPADNPPLQPSHGVYPPLAALPWVPKAGWTSTATKFGYSGVQIDVTLGDGPPAPFFARGINYEPTQIGGSQDFPPFGDFFYTNGPNTWAPLWTRDIGMLRAMAVNSVRVYGTWKWEPGFLSGARSRDGLAAYWKQLDFTVATQGDAPFCEPGNPSALSYPHPDHTEFLDRMWNNGVRPIYVWIAVALPKLMFDPDLDPTRRENLIQFYKYTARWLAQRYGNHPAVIGFVMGNEVDDDADTATSFFWETLNDFNALIKASAPSKLTMAVFTDGPDAFATIKDAPLAGLTGPKVFKLDVLGDNPYNNPADPGNEYARFRDGFVNCTTPAGTPCLKPLLLTEFGTPASAHAALADPTLAYPVPWVGVNALWHLPGTAARCLAPGTAPPPGSGGLGEAAEFEAGTTVAEELPADPARTEYALPAVLAPFFSASGLQAGATLGAAAQAEWYQSFWTDAVARHAASNGPDRDTKLLYASGGYAFEFRDEWGKQNPHPDFHSASGSINCGAGQGCGMGNCTDTGAANPIFSGGWADEQWFGLTSARVNPNRCPQSNFNCDAGNGGNSDPVVNPSTGALNGGPDVLIPRASLIGLCNAFSAASICR